MTMKSEKNDSFSHVVSTLHCCFSPSSGGLIQSRFSPLMHYYRPIWMPAGCRQRPDLLPIQFSSPFGSRRLTATHRSRLSGDPILESAVGCSSPCLPRCCGKGRRFSDSGKAMGAYLWPTCSSHHMVVSLLRPARLGADISRFLGVN